MIQRIQTIYLLISLVAWSLLFFNPVIAFTNDAGGAWLLFANGIREAESGKITQAAVPMLILFVLVEILALISVLAYRRRALQLRITVLNMMLQLLSYGIIALYTVQGKNSLAAHAGLLFFSIMPLLASVCSFLAFRGIRRDMLLLRALDRLR
jgi:CDP-diglyceride synthetase